MFRTVLVSQGEKLNIKDNWLVITSEEGERRIPIGDLYSVVLDNQATVITIPTIHRLTEAGVHLIVCDGKHTPVSVILPNSIHYRPLNVIRKQIGMSQSFKDAL